MKTKKKCATDIGNSRPISVATAASNLREVVIKNSLGEHLQTTSKQFDFKHQHRLKMAIITLKQTLNLFARYLSSNVPAIVSMYLCTHVPSFSGYQKSIDRLNHWTLLKTSLKGGACASRTTT